MSSTQIVLIHPGQTDFDYQGRIMGQLDIPLNAQGTGQVARAVAELCDLPIGQIFTSPCQTAVQTAELITAATSIKTKQVNAFRNADLGLWQGKLVEEVRTQQPKVYRRRQEDPDSVCPPEGEMLSSVRRRVRDALDKIISRSKSDMIAIVAPEPLASVLRSEVSGAELGDIWKADCVCGRWEIIDAVEDNQLAGSRDS